MATVAQKRNLHVLQPLVVYLNPPAVSPKIPVENARNQDAAIKILHLLLAQAVVVLAMTATKILAKEEDVAKLSKKSSPMLSAEEKITIAAMMTAAKILAAAVVPVTAM